MSRWTPLPAPRARRLFRPRTVLLAWAAAGLLLPARVPPLAAQAAPPAAPVAAACTAPTFGSPAAYQVGGEPQSAAVGDFNLDGFPDLAVVNFGPDTLSVLLGIGGGAFTAHGTRGLGFNPIGAAVGHFNDDGKPDLVVANSDSNSVSILLGDGTGAFPQQTMFAVQRGPYPVVVADFNEDGRDDVAVANTFSPQSAPTLSVLLGLGGGALGPQTTFPVGAQPVSLTLADFNRDGHVDLATGNGVSQDVSVLLGTGTGGFAPTLSIAVGANAYVNSARAGDFTGDGLVDLLAATPSAIPPTVAVLPGRGDGSFGAPIRSAVEPGGGNTAVGDLNGDGLLDLVISVGSGLAVSQGRGDGTFAPSVTIAPGSSFTRMAIADLDGDGRPDVVAPSYDNGGTVWAVLNACGPGGRALGIADAPGGGARLTWRGGTVQAGYLVGRVAGGALMVFPSNGGTLPADATAFTDPSPVPGVNNCYVVGPVDATGLLGLSDAECLLPDSSTPSGAPPDFALRLDQSPTATLTWAAPGGQTGYNVLAYPNAAPPPRQMLLGAGATSATDATGGAPTCYVLVPFAGTTVLGHSATLCGVPGYATLGLPAASRPAGGSRQALAAALVRLGETARRLDAAGRATQQSASTAAR